MLHWWDSFALFFRIGHYDFVQTYSAIRQTLSTFALQSMRTVASSIALRQLKHLLAQTGLSLYDTMNSSSCLYYSFTFIMYRYSITIRPIASTSSLGYNCHYCSPILTLKALLMAVSVGPKADFIRSEPDPGRRLSAA